MSDYLKRRLEHINAGRPDNKDKVAQDRWFANIEIREFRGGFALCQECMERIPRSYARHATAHLLAKADYPSVRTHPFNYLILGAGCGCHNKTHRIDTFVKMKVWPKAAERIRSMLDLLTQGEYKKLPQELLNNL